MFIYFVHIFPVVLYNSVSATNLSATTEKKKYKKKSVKIFPNFNCGTRDTGLEQTAENSVLCAFVEGLLPGHDIYTKIENLTTYIINKHFFYS